MKWYIFDYSVGKIYKINITEEKLNEIRQDIINKQYGGDESQTPDEIYNMDDEEVLWYYGFMPDQCEWMTVDEDLEIEEITKPLKI